MTDVFAAFQGHKRALDGDISQIRAVTAHAHAVDVIDCLREALQRDLKLVAKALRTLDDKIDRCGVTGPA
jgi:hypothetical protein